MRSARESAIVTNMPHDAPRPLPKPRACARHENKSPPDPPASCLAPPPSPGLPRYFTPLIAATESAVVRILTFSKCPVQYPVPRSNQSLFRSSYTLTRRGVDGGLGTDSGIIPRVCVRWVGGSSVVRPALQVHLTSHTLLSFSFRSLFLVCDRPTPFSRYRPVDKGSASAVGYFTQRSGYRVACKR